MNRHRNVLYVVVFILLVLQITSFVSLSSHVSKLRSELEKAETNITSLTGKNSFTAGKSSGQLSGRNNFS
jgi:hypothetical protein